MFDCARVMNNITMMDGMSIRYIQIPGGINMHNLCVPSPTRAWDEASTIIIYSREENGRYALQSKNRGASISGKETVGFL